MSSALSGLTSSLPGFTVDDLMALAERPSASYSHVHAALAMATQQDLPALERAFQAADSPVAPYRPPEVTSDLVHTYCELAGSKGFEFLLQWILTSELRIELWDYGPVIQDIASLARRRHLSLLHRIMSLPIFWEIPGQPTADLEVKSSENLHLLRRIVGVAFSRLARREDRPELRRLVTHQYWTIRSAAAEAIARLANIDDLDALVEHALAIPDTERRELIRALCHLDRKYFGDTSERTPTLQNLHPYSLLE